MVLRGATNWHDFDFFAFPGKSVKPNALIRFRRSDGSQRNSRISMQTQNTETMPSEDLMSLAQTAAYLNVRVAQLHRWRLRGRRGRKLETLRIGGKYLTSRQAVARFLGGTSADR